ncbi:MAG: YibE/F family protein [Nocardioidaceae bacterium]|nr:YibE/F family protein [Nocardioidaceae bacterium]
MALIAGATAVGVFALWPHSSDVPKTANPYAGPGVKIVEGTVTGVDPFDCGNDPTGPDGLPQVKGPCGTLTVKVPGDSSASVQVDAARYKLGFSPDDRVELVRIAPSGQPATYEFIDFKRGSSLILLSIIFLIVVGVVARWRGLLAIVGIGVTLLALMKFVLPAILAGENAIVVAVVGSTAIMIIVLYLAHGISIRTTSALFGTLVGIGITGLIGAMATDWTHLTGLGSEDDQTLLAVTGGLDLRGVVAASMIIAGLGVLNDVTVTQASAVWELRAAQPNASAAHTFASAMRIGRDHIASSVYTLVFAYAGSAMTVLLLITVYQRSLTEMATTEGIGTEIVRTLVGAIGLVLAVPITTAFAVLLAPRPAHTDEVRSGI